MLDSDSDSETALSLVIEPASREPSPEFYLRVDNFRKTFEVARRKDPYALAFMIDIMSARIHGPVTGARNWKVDTEKGWEQVVHPKATPTPDPEPEVELPQDPAPEAPLEESTSSMDLDINPRSSQLAHEVDVDDDGAPTNLEEVRHEPIVNDDRE